MQRWNAYEIPYLKPNFSLEEWAILKGYVQTLLDKLEERNIPTIHIRQTPKDGLLGTWSDIQKKFEDQDNDFMHLFGAFDFDLTPDSMVGCKTEPSADSVPGLRDYLRQQDVKVIILSGWSEGHSEYHEGCCVSETAIDFAKDFGVVIVADATNAALPSRWPDDLHLQLPLVELDYRKKDFGRFGVHIDPMDEILRRIDVAIGHAEKPAPPIKATPALITSGNAFG